MSAVPVTTDKYTSNSRQSKSFLCSFFLCCCLVLRQKPPIVKFSWKLHLNENERVECFEMQLSQKVLYIVIYRIYIRYSIMSDRRWSDPYNWPVWLSVRYWPGAVFICAVWQEVLSPVLASRLNVLHSTLMCVIENFCLFVFLWE